MDNLNKLKICLQKEIVGIDKLMNLLAQIKVIRIDELKKVADEIISKRNKELYEVAGSGEVDFGEMEVLMKDVDNILYK